MDSRTSMSNTAAQSPFSQTTGDFNNSPGFSDNSPVPLLASTAQKEMTNDVPDGRPHSMDEFQRLTGSYTEKNDSRSSNAFFNESSLSLLDLDGMRDARMSASLVHIDQSSSDFCVWPNKPSEKENTSLQNSANKSLKDITNVPSTPADYAKIAAKFLLPSSDSQLSNDTPTATPIPGGMHKAMMSNFAQKYQKENFACGENALDSSVTKHLQMSSAEPEASFTQYQDSPTTPETPNTQAGAESMVYALDFLDGNFQNDLQMQQEFLKPEEFLDDTQTNIEKLLDQEEEIFVEENKFMLQSQEHISPNRTDLGFQNASTLSTATMASANSNMSIGEYMTARSEKLGDLGGMLSCERPSFGMELTSPPSRKPMPLLSQQDSSPEADKTMEIKVEESKTEALEENNKTLVDEISKVPAASGRFSDGEEQKSKMDTSVDISMMSISEAISNMSVNMNNEQLANMLMEIARRKQNERKQRTNERESKSAVVPQTTETKSKEEIQSNIPMREEQMKCDTSPHKQSHLSRIPISHNSTLNARKTVPILPLHTLHSRPQKDENQQYATNLAANELKVDNIPSKYVKESSSFFERESGKFVQEVKPISRSQTPEQMSVAQHLHTTLPTHDDTEVYEIEREDIISKQSIQEELPSLLNAPDTSCFPDDCSAKEILSSTRTDFSMLKGSLSRESIEHLHKMLREKGYTKDTDSIKTFSTPRESFSSSGKSDDFDEPKQCINEGEIEACDSKPARCSEGFEQLAARMSLANMETLVDTDFNELHLKDDKKLEAIQEVSNEDVDATQSTVACDDSSNRSSDSQGAASVDSHPTLKINPQNVQSSTLLNPHVYQNHLMFRPPGHENMHSSLPPNYTAGGAYRPVSPMEGAFHLPLPPRGQPTLLTGQSLMSGPMAQEYLARSLSLQNQHQQFYPSMYHQTAPYHMQHYHHTNVPSIGYTGEQSNLTSGTTAAGFNHSAIPPHHRNMHPSYYPGSHSIDLGMHDYYYRPPRPTFTEGRNVISVPSEIIFSGIKCASIISTTTCSVTNNSEQPVQVELNVISPTINCCFNAEGKDRIAPQSSKSFDITFSPNDEGHFKAVLEVSAYMVGMDGKPVKVYSAKVNVSAQAVVADAEIVKGSVGSIDFKESLAGTRKSLPFKIANNTPAELPVCVFLCGMTGKDKAFSISKSSVVDDSSVPQPKHMEMLCITLPPKLSETTLWIHCQVSPDHCDPDQPPKELSATLYMQIDRQCMVSNKDAVVLDTLPITALACVAKLRAPKSMQPLTFTCPKNETQVQRVPVKNCGNIRIKINFSLQNNSLFLISPTHCELNAGETTDLSVTFQPLINTPSQVTNTLYMIIEENKSHFEVMIVAKSVPPNPYNKSRVSSTDKVAEMPTLFANKSFLNWGGVDVGKTMQQKVTLRTSKDGKYALPLRISIKGEDASCFQLMSSEDSSEQLSLNMEATVKPSQDKALMILFSPTNCSLMHAKLEIKTPLDNARFSKFTIPLSGYGGKSDVRFEGLQMLETSNSFDCFYTFSQSIESKAHEKSVDILVKNNGSRDAFVKASFYCDLNCKQVLSDGSVTCTPSQFILSKKTARSITVTFRNLRKNLHTGKDGHDLLACMCLWYGDEISRQLLKHALKSFGPASVNKYVSESNPLREISFDSIYYGEDDNKRQGLSGITPKTCDVQMFYNNLHKAHIQLLGESSASNTTTFKTLFKSLDAYNKPTHAPRPARDSLDHNPVKEVSRASSHSSDIWDLSPDHVVLSLSNNMVAETTKVKVINRSDVPLKFDTAWPAHYLTITPHSGCVDPESVLVLLLSANPSLSSRKDMLPWIGAVQIISREGRGSKQLRVQIRDVGNMSPDVGKPSPSNALTNETFATPLPSMGPKSNASLLRKEAAKKSINQIIVKSTSITFPQATVRSSSNSNLEFTNMSNSNVRWILTSFAPAYVKGSGSTGDLFRSTYAAFVFSHTSGILEPGTKMNVPVSFNPMNAGSYSQFWDLEFHDSSDKAALSLDKIRLQLTGEGVQTTAPTAAIKPRSKEDIYVSEDCLNFSEVSVGSSLTKKIPINNRSRESHNVRFLNVSSPFHITHQKHTIRGKYYASLPITFRPTKPGVFEGELFIQPEHTPLLRVKLVGIGV